MMKKINIIFLDFDGVLNNQEDYIFESKMRKLYKEPILGIYPEYAEYLNEIIKQTNAKIVVSSTWRIGKSVNVLTLMLKNIGVDINKVYDKTPSLTDSKRGDEIQLWLDKHPEVNNFVIIDDESDMAHLKSKLVQTKFKIGLTAEHIKKAIDILKGKYNKNITKKDNL